MRKLDRDDEALPGHDLRWLDPSEAEISLDDHGSLRVRIGDRTWTNVVAIDCLPIARPGEFLSLRHREDAEHTTELGLLQQPNRWPLPQRRLLEAALEARDLWHRVRHVYGVDLVNDLLTMNVETQLGPVELTVKRGPHWAHDVPGGKLFVDVDEDRYVLPSDRRLTKREQELLRRYADG